MNSVREVEKPSGLEVCTKFASCIDDNDYETLFVSPPLRGDFAGQEQEMITAERKFERHEKHGWPSDWSLA